MIAAMLVIAPQAGAQQVAAPSTRLMDDLNWMEFRQLVPAKIKTVIVTVGTLEPHGVVNNGADNTAPVAIANAIAGDVNALIAPHVPYGVAGSMSPYPGALHIPEEAFRGYMRAVLEGMVKNNFRNIIIINGHGGPQTAILQHSVVGAGQRHHAGSVRRRRRPRRHQRNRVRAGHQPQTAAQGSLHWERNGHSQRARRRVERHAGTFQHWLV
jgi:creatinine amidohydrolase/Fe(II)-dependent formamide hydrolase-like protein